MSAREIIAQKLPENVFPGAGNTTAWANIIMSALTAAGYRILGPDEIDPVTAERALSSKEGR